MLQNVKEPMQIPTPKIKLMGTMVDPCFRSQNKTGGLDRNYSCPKDPIEFNITCEKRYAKEEIKINR